MALFKYFEISDKFLSSKLIQAEQYAWEHLPIKRAPQSIQAFIFNKHGFHVPSDADTVFMSQSSLLKMCHFFVEINIVQSRAGIILNRCHTLLKLFINELTM